jgi:parallel beta-helix repeat protein
MVGDYSTLTLPTKTDSLIVYDDSASEVKKLAILNLLGNVHYPDYNEADQGVAGSGSSVKTFVDAISTDSATLVLRHNSGSATTTYTFSTSETIPSNINVIIEKGAILSIAAAQTLTINGSFDAGLYQVFSGTGSVAGLKVSNILWFGAVSDSGTTDNTAAIKAAYASLVAGGKLFIPYQEGYYKYDNDGGLTDAVAITQAVTVQLDGTIKSTSSTNDVNPPYIFNVTGANFVLKGVGTLQGPGTFVVNEGTDANCPGLLKLNANNCIVDGITFVDSPEIAIHIPNKTNITIINNKFTGGPLIADAMSPQHYYILAHGGNQHIISGNKFYATSGGSCRSAICYGAAVHAQNLTVTNNQFTDIHEHALYISRTNDSVVSNNIVLYTQAVVDQQGNAMKIGGNHNVVTGNQINNAAFGGINLLAAYDCIISNNMIFDFGFVGIEINNNVVSAVGYNRNIIDSNLLIGRTDGEAVYEGIRYCGMADTTAHCLGGKITNNSISNAGTAAAAIASIGVYHSNASYNMLDFDISGNKIRASKMTSIYLNRVTKSKINHNTIYSPIDANNRVFYIDNTTYCTLEGNIARDDQSPAVIDAFIHLNGVGNAYIELINNGCFTTGNVAILGLNATYQVLGRGNRLSEEDRLTGTFTMNNIAFLVINNSNISNTSLTNSLTTIQIRALDDDAAIIMGSSSLALYVSAKVAKTSFTVRTALNGAVAANTAIFAYEIIQ